MRFLFVRVAACLVILVLCAARLEAQSITGTLTAYDHSDYAGIASHFRIENAQYLGEAVPAGSVNIFGADFEAYSLDEDPGVYPRPVDLTVATVDNLDTWERFSVSQNEAYTKAQLHWLIDNYYDSFFLNTPDNTDARQYAFQNVIWEIMYDGGTPAGLNFSTGLLDRDKFSNTAVYGPELWFYMTGLLSAVDNSGVTAAYAGSTTVYSALDSRPGYQDYILLTTDLSEQELTSMPEPRILLLALLGAPLALRRRRS